MKHFLLVILLSIFSAPLFLGAQQCISDLTVEIDQCEPGGIFTGLLSFEHSPNVDSVSIYYDNAFFGNHATNNLPIVLYPLQGDGQSHTVVVEDSDVSSCRDSLNFAPFCDPAETCNSEIHSVSSFCIGTFLHVTVNYSFIDPVSEVHIRVNGEYVTNGMVGENVSQTFTVPASSNSVYEIQVLDPEFLSCSDVAFLQVSPCVDNCISEFDAAGTTCNTDGTYNLNFFLSDSLGGADVYIDGQLETSIPASDSTDFFTLNQLVSDSIPTSHEITVCLQINPSCCTTLLYDDPLCTLIDSTELCSITNSSLEFECFADEGVFTASLTFDHSGIEGDTVKVEDFNGNLIGFYDVNEQPITINQAIDSSQSRFGVVIYNALDEQCTSETILYDIPCFDFCQIFWIEYDVLDCNPDGTYNAEIFYGLESINAQVIIAAVNGNIVDSVAVSTANNSFVLSSIVPQPGTNVDILTLCIEGFSNCCFTVELSRPICEPEDCMISSFAPDIVCLENGEYTAEVMFEAERTSDSLNIFIDGQFLSTIDATQTNFTFGPFENGTPHFYTIEDAQDGDCFIRGDIFTQQCSDVTGPCMVDFIEVDSLVCNDNGTYNVSFVYDTSNSNNDLIDVTVNGLNIDVFLNNGFINLFEITPRANSDFDIIQICVNDNPDCCKTIEYAQPECDIADCVLEEPLLTYECLGNGQYTVIMTLDSINAVDTVTYTVLADGQFAGVLNTNERSLSFGPYQNGSLHTYTIANANGINCILDGEIFTQGCGDISTPCSVDLIQIDSLGCKNDGTYDMRVSYATSNNSSNLVDVTVNGQNIDVFSNSGFLMLSDITPRSNSDFDIIEICVNDIANCCNVFEYMPPVCTPDSLCNIEIVDIQYECIGNQGLYEAFIIIDTENASGSYTLEINGASNTVAAVNNVISLGTFENGTQGSFILSDRFDDNCFVENEFFWQECGLQTELCAVDFIEVDSIGCNSNGTYDMTVSFGTSNETNDLVDVTVNGVNIDVFLNNGFLNLFDITPRPNSDFDIIQICVNDNPDCCKTIEYAQTNCDDAGDCLLSERLVEYECLGNGEYVAIISFLAENTSGVFEVFVDGQFQQVLQSGAHFVEAGPFENGTSHNYLIVDAQNPNCGVEGNMFTQECIVEPTLCNIEFIEILATSCNDDSTFNMDVLYLTDNANNDFVDIFLNGEFFGFYDIDSLVTLESIPLSLTTEVKTITVCVNDNPDCCKTVDYNQPECGSTSTCELDDLVVEYECNEDTGEIIPLLFFSYDTVATSEVIVNLDGINIGFYNPSDQPIILDPLKSNSADVWTFTVSDASDGSCTTSAILEDVDCGGECIITGITVEEECLTDGTVLVFLDFFSYNTSGQVMVNGNGTQYGVFDVDQFPIEIGPLDPTDNDNWEFIVSDVSLDNCSSFIGIEKLGCDDVNEIECTVEAIEVFNIDCIGGNEYSMSVDFDIPGNANVPFSFFLNGNLMNTTSTSSLPLNLIGLLPNDSTGVETITICLEGLEDCCFDYTYETPNCLSNAVDQSLLDGVNLNPNPTIDIVHINHIPQEVIGLNIIDNMGRSIIQMVASEDMQIDVSNFAEGIYTVQFFTADNKVMNMRFVKMN